jgi:hypothetical protein
MGANDEELFSMDDIEKKPKPVRRVRRLPWFAAGLVLGVAAAIAGPRFLGPFLPESLTGRTQILTGPVLAEERDGDRLLLTLETEPGALIASFSQRVSEIAQLVEPGDIVSIAVRDYDPFVEDPDFEGVRKGNGTRPPVADSASAEVASPDSAMATPDSMPPARDTAGG